MGSNVLWAIVGGFLAGVFIRSFVPLGFTFSLFFALLGLIILALTFLDKEKLRVGIVVASALFSLGLGLFRMDAAVKIGDPHLTEMVGEEVTLRGVVVKEPDIREKGDRLSISVHELVVGSSTITVSAGTLVLAPPHSGISYGDEIEASGKLRLPEAFETGEGRAFNYPYYLAAYGIVYELAFAKTKKLSSGHGNSILSAAISLKHFYVRGMGAALPEPEAGLASGITVGDKRSLGSELTEEFQKVSLIHMVVLSGYNITVVMDAAARLLAFAPRTAQFGTAGFIALFFVLMSGGAASAVRAGSMALIGVFARATSRVFLAARALGVVAFLMVLWDPFTLAFDPSFQLSALATLGLIFFTPLFTEKLTWITERFAIRETAAATLGTQTAVLPLLLYQNGEFPLYALPANLLALIPVPLAMLFSLIAAVAGMLFGTYAVPFGAPAYILLAYIVGVAHVFSSLPFASVSIPAFSPWLLAFLYTLLVATAVILHFRRKIV